MSHHDDGRSDTDARPESEKHRGDFAEGPADTHVKPGAVPGDFARGLRDEPPTGEERHRGDFAEGQAATHTPPDAKPGDYARGVGDDDERSDAHG